MKSPIIIEKMKDENGVHYYMVETDRYGHFKFVIAIDVVNNKVHFYALENMVQPIGTINFSEKNHLHEISGLDQNVTTMTAVQAYRALQKNDFPDDLTIYI